MRTSTTGGQPVQAGHRPLPRARTAARTLLLISAIAIVLPAQAPAQDAPPAARAAPQSASPAEPPATAAPAAAET
ncbi:hypothetical protein, partial [Propylenella binzhouense]|uniref:hypothetical protein n=1 Tax=Propylenella binzhouense TaxID=2555902 RepID=UPI001968184C